MDYIFESIKEESDYGVIKDKVLYKENKDILEGQYSENEFVSLDDETKKKISTELKLNFKFVLTFGTSITAFFPIIESFILNSGIDQIELNRETVVYLGICALAIIFDQPKETYRKLFSELRLRNVYVFLEDLTKFINKLKDIFNFVVSMIGKVVYDIYGMFNYTALFVPFALTIATIFQANHIDLSSIMNAIITNGIGKLLTVSIGTSGIIFRELIIDLINQLKNFKFNKVRRYLSKSFSKIRNKVNYLIKKFNDNVNMEEVEKKLKDEEKLNIKNTNTEDPKILKWSDWKVKNDLPNNIERIDEEK